jgi:hypothetical protein
MNQKAPKGPPITYAVNPDFARDTLSYREMIALSGLFRRWALYDPSVTPDYATQLIKWSSDYERLAEWFGPGWKPEDTFDWAERIPFTKFVAQIEIEDSRVIPLAAFRKLHSA